MAKNLAALIPTLSRDELAWLQLFARWVGKAKYSGYKGNYYSSLEDLNIADFILCDAEAAYKLLDHHWAQFANEWPQLIDEGRVHAIAITSLRPKLMDYVKEPSSTDPQAE